MAKPITNDEFTPEEKLAQEELQREYLASLQRATQVATDAFVVGDNNPSFYALTRQEIRHQEDEFLKKVAQHPNLNTTQKEKMAAWGARQADIHQFQAYEKALDSYIAKNMPALRATLHAAFEDYAQNKKLLQQFDFDITAAIIETNAAKQKAKEEQKADKQEAAVVVEQETAAEQKANEPTAPPVPEEEIEPEKLAAQFDQECDQVIAHIGKPKGPANPEAARQLMTERAKQYIAYLENTPLAKKDPGRVQSAQQSVVSTLEMKTESINNAPKARVSMNPIEVGKRAAQEQSNFVRSGAKNIASGVVNTAAGTVGYGVGTIMGVGQLGVDTVKGVASTIQSAKKLVVGTKEPQAKQSNQADTNAQAASNQVTDQPHRHKHAKKPGSNMTLRPGGGR